MQNETNEDDHYLVLYTSDQVEWQNIEVRLPFRMSVIPKIGSLLILMLFVLASCNTVKKSKKTRGNDMLWYTRPAQKWTQALPIGNGRMGAMVYGRVDTETVQLNDESLWAGQHMDANNPEAKSHLKRIQRLILNGKNIKAQQLGQKYLVGTPPSIRSYQPVGDLKILLDNGKNENKKITDYKRGLNFSTGLAWVSYKIGDNVISRETFASAPDNIIVEHLQSTGNKGLSGKIMLARSKDAKVKAISNHTLEMDGQIIDKPNPKKGPGGKHMKFSARLEARTKGGTITAGTDFLQIKNVKKLTILITSATDYNFDALNINRSIHPEKICKNIIKKANSKSYAKLKKAAIANNQKFYNRVHFILDYPNKDSLDQLPTTQRLDRFQQGKSDPGLYALYFNYGRYLLASSSRPPGILPANLQGLWNNKLHAPWNSDYHLDINLEMNYWPAEITNLSGTMLPLIHFMNHLRVPGRKTAKKMYGAKGWTVHHATDEFGRTSVIDGIRWGEFPTGASWLCLSVWRHYAYTQNKDYLRKLAYPIMIGAAKFDLSFMIKDKKGQLVTDPSSSAEHEFIVPHTGGRRSVLTDDPTQDIELIAQLFHECIKASHILHKNSPFIHKLKKAQNELPSIQIGKDGTIQEWIKDYKDPNPGFSEMVHLLGLFPGDIINRNTPKLFSAAKRTIKKRLNNGGGGTGWSRAWIANLYDRLNDGKEAYKNMSDLLANHTFPNFFDAINKIDHKGFNPFQIDANFGGTSAIAHMFVQSTNGTIRILPALPPQWHQGAITGLKARGNFTIGIHWANNSLKNLSVTSHAGGKCHLKYKNHQTSFNTVAGKTYRLNNKLQPESK